MFCPFLISNKKDSLHLKEIIIEKERENDGNGNPEGGRLSGYCTRNIRLIRQGIAHGNCIRW